MRIPVFDLLPDHLQHKRRSLEMQQKAQKQTLDFLRELPDNERTPISESAPRGHASIAIYGRGAGDTLSYHAALAVSSGPPTRIVNLYRIAETAPRASRKTPSFHLQHAHAHMLTFQPQFVGALLLSSITQGVTVDDVDRLLQRFNAEPQKGDWGEESWSSIAFVIKLVRELEECGMLEKELDAHDSAKFYRRLQARAQMLAAGVGNCFVCGDLRVLEW
ncbi:hypothetical protein PENSPDRAFT_685910 [Peniophora sp. CONT]|nr:hypothetical protein PENSPDRAFT_685910 [Peniophora sp. CONT]